MKFLLKFLATLLASVFGALTLVILGLLAAYLYLAPQLPSVETLKDVHLQVPLRIYARGGELIAEFGEQRRTPVPLAQVPALMRQAVLAAEDDRFYQHPGVDYQGMLRAALHLLKTGEKTQGGSTITMQVARNSFLGSEKTYARKLTEILLALKIERDLTKDEILALYLNQIFLGSRAYGVAAAAQAYFGKSLDKLSLGEIATIAGLPKAPSRDNPFTDPERAAARRAYVLGRMRELGYISADAYKKAMAEPVPTHPPVLTAELDSPYIAETARADLVARYGTGAYTDGYEVYTTVDARLQRLADAALRRALLDYDVRHGYRGPVKHVALPKDGEAWREVLQGVPTRGGLTPALVTRVERRSAALYLEGGKPVSLAWEGMSWARRYVDENHRGPAPKKAADIMAPGDIVYVEQDGKDVLRLSELPAVEGALLAMSPEDGAIVALSGGFDFYRSKFNRITQAQRQPGSSFKPFIYSAALEKGFTPASLINDAPVVIEGGGQEESWRPENYTGIFYGPTRLREALVHSRNLVSIRLLRSIGIDYAIDYLARFGFQREQMPRGLSLALGTASLTPLQLSAGYAVFANGGLRVRPQYIQRILDFKGQTVWQASHTDSCTQCAASQSPTSQAPASQSGAERVVSPQNAYLITSMMTDVVRRGTAKEARSLGRQDLAGKTGTTNDWNDAWFCGFNGALLATAWVGFDQPRSLGRGETGARAALPMWMGFMGEALKDTPERPLAEPPGLVTVRIDPDTGLLARPNQRNVIFETFQEGYAPTQVATVPLNDVTHPHEVLSIPEQLF